MQIKENIWVCQEKRSGIDKRNLIQTEKDKTSILDIIVMQIIAVGHRWSDIDYIGFRMQSLLCRGKTKGN